MGCVDPEDTLERMIDEIKRVMKQPFYFYFALAALVLAITSIVISLVTRSPL